MHEKNNKYIQYQPNTNQAFVPISLGRLHKYFYAIELSIKDQIFTEM